MFCVAKLAFHFQAGTGEMEVDDKTFEIKAGVTVTVYPGETHEIRYKRHLMRNEHTLKTMQRKHEKDKELNVRCRKTEANVFFLLFANGNRNTGSENLVIIYFGIVE